MRRALVIAAALATLASLTGCDAGTNASEINALCKPYGGVISSDYHGDIVVCADKVARDAP